VRLFSSFMSLRTIIFIGLTAACFIALVSYGPRTARSQQPFRLASTESAESSTPADQTRFNDSPPSDNGPVYYQEGLAHLLSLTPGWAPPESPDLTYFQTTADGKKLRRFPERAGMPLPPPHTYRLVARLSATGRCACVA
jgi:hypothetical protein